MIHKAKVAVFISGGGSNLQALIDAANRDELDAEISLVVSNRKKAYGLTRATDAGIETFVFKLKNYVDASEAADDLFTKLQDRKIAFIVCAGYLKLLPEKVVKAYPGKIINIHPALLPKYGGKGMYGHHVHEAVIANRDKESGPTIHLVNERYDEGKIIEQVKVAVLADDTPETLAERVLAEEHKLLPKTLHNLIKGKYKENG